MFSKRSFCKLLAVAACFSVVCAIGDSQTLQGERRAPNEREKAGLRTAQAERTIDAQSRQMLSDIIAHLLDTMYVSPETGRQLAAQMRAKFAGGVYDKMTGPAQLAEALTQDLRALGKDRHLYVRFNPEAADMPVPTVAAWEKERQQRGAMASARTRTPGGEQPRQMEIDARETERLRQANYHFRKLERLAGNVGYLDLGGFASGGEAREAAAKAMAFLAETDAVIIDLRRCPGGSTEMVNFLASYFFGPEPRVLMNRYLRPMNETIQSTTVSEIPGRRMPDKDLYLLTSAQSGSACESFPYTLQQYGRAKIVGEQTAGAGYNNMLIPIGYGLTLSVSYGRPVHPRSGRGWEGVGVQPDIAVPADTALTTAHKEALKSLMAKSTDDNRRQELTRALQSVEQNVAPVRAAPAALADYVGRYGNKEISIKDDGLYYQRIGGRGAALRATGKDQFALNADAQITFTRNAQGVVTEMLIEWVERDKEQLKREAPTETQSGSAAQLPMTSQISTDDALTKELTADLEQAASADAFSGVVLVAKNGRPIFRKAYGTANQNTKAPNNAETKFNVGSMNKMFTAVAIAQLAEKGKLSFTDLISKHLPDYPNKAVADKVTIHQLLTHTSGMGNYQNEKFYTHLDKWKSTIDLLPLFADEPLNFAPGAKWEYSNAGYVVLGLIIEKVSGRNYFDYVKENIFKPARMTDTDSYEKTAQVTNLATGYTRMNADGRAEPATPRRANTPLRPIKGSPAGGGYSTVDDLLKFSIALKSNKLLSQKFTDILTTGTIEVGGPIGKYAYGFSDKVFGGRHIIGHNGGSQGIGANLDIFPELGYTAIVLTNYDSPAMMPLIMKIRGLIPVR